MFISALLVNGLSAALLVLAAIVFAHGLPPLVPIAAVGSIAMMGLAWLGYAADQGRGLLVVANAFGVLVPAVLLFAWSV